jgi:hypothetical protein
LALEERKLVSYLLDLRGTLWVWINWVALVHVAIFLQAIFGAFSDNTSVKLAGWIVIAGVCFGLFAFVVPTLHALRFFSSCSLFLSLIYTCIAIGVSFSDGLKSPPRDYSLKGTRADRTFNAIGALATIAFAYNTGILPEMQVLTSTLSLIQIKF